ncbi:unnamed protein product [Rangifer tarandus platyrhynchus]|uniref:Uncharacterized protein n=1 Tax=Rangifer tarandus platyrhynchus TaxID=3082113 RepID=A0ABN8YVQ2_RANTA|nr:unnamed protein product [Rangifer tarandus platyrhynchus]
MWGLIGKTAPQVRGSAPTVMQSTQPAHPERSHANGPEESRQALRPATPPAQGPLLLSHAEERAQRGGEKHCAGLAWIRVSTQTEQRGEWTRGWVSNTEPDIMIDNYQGPIREGEESASTRLPGEREGQPRAAETSTLTLVPTLAHFWTGQGPPCGSDCLVPTPGPELKASVMGRRPLLPSRGHQEGRPRARASGPHLRQAWPARPLALFRGPAPGRGGLEPRRRLGFLPARSSASLRVERLPDAQGGSQASPNLHSKEQSQTLTKDSQRNLELISPTPHAAEGEPRPVRDAAAASRFSTIGASWACPPLALVVEQRVPRAWALVLYRGPQ